MTLEVDLRNLLAESQEHGFGHVSRLEALSAHLTRTISCVRARYVKDAEASQHSSGHAVH